MIQDFIQGIQSQLRNYSSGLRQMNNLVDIPWTMVDGDLSLQKLIFKRNNSLYIITEGVIQESAWEYLPSMNSLAISIDGRRILMNEVFLDGTVLILKKDGSSQALMAFVNESELLKVDLVSYLDTKINGDLPPPVEDDPMELNKLIFWVVILSLFLLAIGSALS